MRRGTNQSAIVAMAWLMAARRMNMAAAARWVKLRQPHISPSVEYIWQLLHYKLPCVDQKNSPKDFQTMCTLLTTLPSVRQCHIWLPRLVDVGHAHSAPSLLQGLQAYHMETTVNRAHLPSIKLGRAQSTSPAPQLATQRSQLCISETWPRTYETPDSKMGAKKTKKKKKKNSGDQKSPLT